MTCVAFEIRCSWVMDEKTTGFGSKFLTFRPQFHGSVLKTSQTWGSSNTPFAQGKGLERIMPRPKVPCPAGIDWRFIDSGNSLTFRVEFDWGIH